MEAQLKKRPIFKAPRPAGRRDALTPRAGAGAADPFSSSDDDSQKDEEAVLERLARPPHRRPRALCKKTCHVKCDDLRSVPAEDWYCVDCREPQCGPSCICRAKKRRA